MKKSTAILWAASLGYGMVILDTSVLNVALPSIASDVGASGTQQRWIIDAYVLVMTAMLLAGGGLIDRFGAKKIFITGVTIFVVASAACAAVTTPNALIWVRALQGVGGAMLIPATLTVVITHFTEPAARGKAIAIIATVTASPQAFGPTLGGVLVDTLGWRSIFLLNLPIAAVTLILGRRISAGASHPRRLDITGTILFALALGAATYAVIDISENHVFGFTPVASLCVAVAAGALFVVVERLSKSPVLPPAILASYRVHAVVLAGTAMFVLFYGALFAANLYFQNVLHLNALTAGLLLLPAGVPVFALPLVVSKVAKGRSPLGLALGGTVLATAGAAIALLAGSGNGAVVVSISLLVVGIGFGIASPPHLNLATAAAPAGATGVMSALANAGRQAGYLLGVAAVGSAAVSVLGFKQAAVIPIAGGILAIIGLVIASRKRSASGSSRATNAASVPTAR